MSLKYSVEIAYLETGNLGGKLDKIGSSIGSMHGGFGQLNSAMGNTLDMVGSLALGVIGLGVAGAAAFGALGGHVVKLSSDLENTGIALAATFASFGAAKNFDQGTAMAADQITKMRKDAAELPGEFKDLANIMQSMAPSALHVMDPDQMRQMAARTMAVAAIDNIPFNVAAREMAALIEGKAGAQNILGRKMMGLTGDKAKAFNHLSMDKRVEAINKELNKDAYTQAIEAYKHSFTGLITTVKDRFKLFATDAGAPMYGRIKTALEYITAWIPGHTGLIDAWATRIGDGFARAFDYGLEKFKEWEPAIVTFIRTAEDEFHRLWSGIGPVVEKAGGVIKNALTDPNSIKHIETMIKLYGGLKLAGIAGGGLGGAGDMLGLGAGIEGMGLAAVAATPAILMLATAIGALTSDDKTLNDFANKKADEGTASLVNAWKNTEDQAKRAASEMRPLSDTIGALGIAAWASNLEVLNLAMQGVTEQTGKFQVIMNMLRGDVDAFVPKEKRRHDEQLVYKAYSDYMTSKPGSLSKPEPPPNAGTHIQKVEIVIQTNQDPLRIARFAVGEMVKVANNPLGATRAPSFMTNR